MRDYVAGDAKSSYSYNEIKINDFALKYFDLQSLARFSGESTGFAKQPIFAVQPSIIPGGILVVFQLHHAIGDGKTLSQPANFTGGLRAQGQRPPKLELDFQLRALEHDVDICNSDEVIQHCSERELVKVTESTVTGHQWDDVVRALVLASAPLWRTASTLR